MPIRGGISITTICFLLHTHAIEEAQLTSTARLLVRFGLSESSSSLLLFSAAGLFGGKVHLSVLYDGRFRMTELAFGSGIWKGIEGVRVKGAEVYGMEY